jgi:hypothetical protein
LYWEEFLEDNNNIWKALKYLDKQVNSLYARVSLINKIGIIEKYTIEDHKIGKELLQVFFLTLPVYKDKSEEISNTYS